MTDKLLKIKIQDANSIVFEGEADQVSSYNEMGQFDIYPMHANFISLIKKSVNIYKNKQLLKEIKLETAILKVKEDNLDIYLGLESLDIEDETKSTDNSTKPSASQDSAK